MSPLVHLIPPTAAADWHLYDLGQSTTDDLSTGSDQEQDDEGVDTGADAGPDAQQPVRAAAPSTYTMTEADHTTVQSAVVDLAALCESDAARNGTPSPGSSPPHDLRHTPPIEVPTHASPSEQDQHPESPSHLDHRTSGGNDLPATIEDLPANAKEAQWMKTKRTLKYFRKVHKVGKLASLVFHWYQLEEVLGFPETVSCLAA